MTIKEMLAALPGADILGKAPLSRAVEGGYVSDLPSAALAAAPEGAVWITSRAEPVVFAVAARRKLSAVVLAGGPRPDPDVIAQADKSGLVVITYGGDAFSAAGKIFVLMDQFEARRF